MWSWIKRAWAWFTSDELTEQVQAVQRAVREMCNYIPTAASVAAMLTAANPIVVGVAAVATAICTAVRPGRFAPVSGGCPQVNGVCVEGEWGDPKPV